MSLLIKHLDFCWISIWKKQFFGIHAISVEEKNVANWPFFLSDSFDRLLTHETADNRANWWYVAFVVFSPFIDSLQTLKLREFCFEVATYIR